MVGVVCPKVFALQRKIYLLSRIQLLSYFQVLVRIDMDDLARGLVTLVVTVCLLVTSDFKSYHVLQTIEDRNKHCQRYNGPKASSV